MDMSVEETAALAPERRRRLISMLRHAGAVRVAVAARELGVSPSTVRRDLHSLERQGLLVRVHGGAAMAGFPPSPRPTLESEVVAKAAIAAAAAGLVRDDMTIMLLSGSTVAAMVPLLADRRGLTIVTNNLIVAHAAADPHADHTVLVLGGMVHREQMTLVGTMAEQNMRGVHVDLMFGGAWGVDSRLGATGTKILVAGRRNDLLDHADAVIVLADSSKLGRTGAAQFASPDQITRVITDAGAPPDQVSELRAAGIVVDVCPSSAAVAAGDGHDVG